MDFTSTNLLLKSRSFICYALFFIFISTSVTNSWGQTTSAGKGQPIKEKKKKAKLPPQDLSGAMLANATYNFSSAGLKGTSLGNPTSLQFGPDNRLYVSQQDGIIKAFNITRNAPGDYSVVTGSTETISIINQIPNHNDDGTLASTVTKRQVTGILVTGSAEQPILYVSSSDSRIGGGSTNGDKNLDTNSGIISKLTKTGSTWVKVDLVRGLPRSEENHSVNGMQLDAKTNMLYLAVGGHTNGGSPSNNFAFTPEYALSAAILSINLTSIEALPTKGTGNTAYKYDLPTVDDPTRANNADGTDVNDPFGGNDGLNQARIVKGGPVQIYSPGYRNAYDLVITQTPGKAGRMYTVDNGANGGWGGYPENEGSDGTVTNNYVVGEPGSNGAGVNDPKVNNLDNLHYIGDIATYIPRSNYGGHPNPTRANPAGAGLYTHDGTSGVWRTSKTGDKPLPIDWPPVPLDMAHKIEGDFQQPGVTDNAILTFNTSTNGIAEYTASNFGNALQGNLLAASHNGSIYKITLTEDGSDVTNPRSSTNKLNSDLPFASGFGSTPLDIIAQGDNDVFPGTVWAATYGSKTITVFEPQDFVDCSGEYSATLDDDLDGYSNADEIDNATNPCSASSRPNDNDGDLVSDLNDLDEDNDGIADNTDAFAIDADNGLTTHLPINYTLFNNDPGTGLYGLGFTGLMSNQKADNDYYNLYDDDNLIAGGAVGAFSVVAVSAGDALGTQNNQENAFQFGVMAGKNPFTVQARMLAAFFNDKTPQNGQSQGIYIGTGDQDNYLKIVLNANGGVGGILVVNENGGQFTSQQYPLPGGLPSSSLDFYLSVNPLTGMVQPKYAVNGGLATDLGEPIQISGPLLQTLQGNIAALAIGIISTTGGAPAFTATWDQIQVIVDPSAVNGGWQTITSTAGSVIGREENAYVQAGDKFYLLGGRGLKAVQEYNPATKTWTNKAPIPTELHHFQAVTLDGLIYAVGAFTGAYPHETPVPQIYIYNPLTDKWIAGPAIPEARRRGSAGIVVYNNKLYVVSGILDGHWTGHVPWFDEYDPATNTWKTLPDAPRPRDHFHAAVINDKLYVASGRRSSGITGQVFSITVPEVDVYDFATGQWSTLPSTSNIPTQRAGAGTAVLGEELIIMGGESSQPTGHVETEALDVNTGSWRRLADMVQGRHGTQAITNNNGIYIVTGAGNQGGGPLLSSQEAYYMNAPTTPIGTALSQSQLTAPTKAAFGYVIAGSAGSQTIRLTNAGTKQAIVVSAINISGDNAYTYTSPLALPFIVPAGKSIDVLVGFSPTSTGTKAANLVINHSGSNTSTTVALTGEGTGQGLVATPANLHFFSQLAGSSSSPQEVTITNDATTSLQVTSVSLSGANSNQYAHNFTAPITINPGASALVSVTFNPASLGTKVAQLDIVHTGINPGLTVTLTGEGIDNSSGSPSVSTPIPDQTATIGTAFSYPIPATTFTDPNNDALTYAASLADNAALPTWLSFAAATRTFSGTPPSGSPASLAIKVTANDGKGGTVSDEFVLSIASASGGVTAIRLNAGGPAYLASNNRQFQADAYYTTNRTYQVSSTTQIANTDDDALYQTERSDANFSYNIPVSNATYNVILHFAEIYWGAEGPGGTGKRQFNVDIEGSRKLTNYDIYAKVGGALIATQETFQVNVSDGTLNINFSKGAADAPKISAIEILKTDATPTNSPPVVATAIPDQHATVGTAFSYAFPTTTFTDSNNDALTYAASLADNVALPTWLSFNGSSRTFSGTPPSGSPASLTIKVTANDGKGGTISDSFVLTITTPTPTVAYRINAGGAQVTNSIGTFAADAYYSGGGTTTRTKAIAGTEDDAMYQSERSASANNANFSYAFPVSSGQYKVVLHFTEVYYGNIGKRIFDVAIENTKVLDNYDILATVGANTADVKTFMANVTDGTLNITFIGLTSEGAVDRPKVSAIEILKTDATPTNSPPVVATAIPDQHATVGTAFSYAFPTTTFTDSNNDALTYAASLADNVALPTWLSFNGSSRTFSGTPPSGSPASLTIKVTANDGKGGTISDSFVLTITTPTPTVAYRINAGGAQVTNSIGTFAADAYYSGGGTTTRTKAIAGTEDDAMYQSERSASANNANFSYAFPVSSGQYKVVLHFTEVYYGNIGKRIFDVAIENTKVLDNYDILATVGANTADVKTFMANVTDGTLNITFIGLTSEGAVDRPKVSAIEVTKITTTTSATNVVAAAVSVKEPIEIKAVSDINITAYPNIFNDYINVKIEAEEPAEYGIKVYDVVGTMLYQKSFTPISPDKNIHTIDLSKNILAKGMYLIYVENKNKKLLKVIKVIKDR